MVFTNNHKKFLIEKTFKKNYEVLKVFIKDRPSISSRIGRESKKTDRRSYKYSADIVFNPCQDVCSFTKTCLKESK